MFVSESGVRWWVGWESRALQTYITEKGNYPLWCNTGWTGHLVQSFLYSKSSLLLLLSKLNLTKLLHHSLSLFVVVFGDVAVLRLHLMSFSFSLRVRQHLISFNPRQTLQINDYLMKKDNNLSSYLSALIISAAIRPHKLLLTLSFNAVFCYLMRSTVTNHGEG